MGRAAELLLEEVRVDEEEAEEDLGEGGENDDHEEERGKDPLVVESWKHHAVHMENMRNRLLTKLQEGFDEFQSRQNNYASKAEIAVLVRPNGPSDPKLRLPNTLSVGLKGVQSGALLAKIGNIVACSAGSACHSTDSTSCAEGHVAPTYSNILKCMNVEPEYAIGTLRLSVGPFTTKEDVDMAADVIVKEALRQLEG
mmetsp:Transcript_3444/g.7035  ORF Transcript_3444/g.7035 Transcript_3444/m.7035 type:complete len:198 (+) Transcript_3444:25-618(+)